MLPCLGVEGLEPLDKAKVDEADDQTYLLTYLLTYLGVEGLEPLDKAKVDEADDQTENEL